MDSLDIVKFGIFDDFSHVFGTGVITNVIPLNHREMIISTTKEIIKIEKSIIKMRHPIKFATCAIVPGTDFLIGVTIKKSDIVIYQIGDLPAKQQSYNSRSIELPPPILDNYPTNQSGIFHMIYSPKSQSIITIGAGIKVFTLQYKLSRISVIKPTISITHRSFFASDYATTILVPPAFDIDTELLLLPTNEGICAYNLDGEPIMLCSKFPASVSTVYATHPSKPPKLKDIPDEKNNKVVRMSKKLLTYDSNKGMALWGKKGQLIDQFNTIGSSVLAIMFVDSENALCLNSNHALFYLNIKTGKTFFCLNLEKNPSRLFLTFVNKEPFLCACFSSFMRALKVVIPWHVWNLNIDKTLLMNRCNKFRSAARVLINAENSFIKLYSPRDGSKMTVATPAEAARPVSFLYDRGIVEKYIFDERDLKYSVAITKITKPDEKEKEKSTEEEEDSNEKGTSRDILFIILENGTILGFDTNVSNCEEVMKMKCKAAFMSICRIHSDKKRHHQESEEEGDRYQWCYAVASAKSDLFILDYFSMKEVRHFTVSDDALIKMFYHFESECIVMVFERKTILFDIEKGKIIDTVLVGGNQITSFFANFLIFGYESGHIRRVSIENRQFVLCNDAKKKKMKNNENEDQDEDDNAVTSLQPIGDKKNSTLQRPHSGRITGFSFSQKIWISSGLDGTVIVWDYNFEKVYKICLPLPLRSCLIMNGKRDILVATETEVMQIKSNYLIDYFENDPFDIEIDEIDNFDKIKDALCHDRVEPFDPDSYDNLSMSNVLSDESESEEEEVKQKNNTKKKFNFSNTSKTIAKKLIDSTPVKKTSENESPKESSAPKTNNKPTDDSPENIQKKLEMMQAMNGFNPSSTGPASVAPPAPSSSNANANANTEPKEPKKEEEKKPKEEEPKVVETKKKKPPKDGKALNDFISNNMEQEKAQSKRKKVKKTNNQDNEQPKDEGPKKSEAEIANMIGNLFDRNKSKDSTNQNTKKKASGEGIDFNELAKKFHKDEDPLVVNLDKADLSKKAKNNDENDDDDYEDDEEEKTTKSKPKETTKPKPTSTPKSNANTTQKTNNNSNSNSTPKSNTTAKPKEKEKENTKSNANQSSKSNTTIKPKEKEKEKANTKSNSKENDNKTTTESNKGKEKKTTKSSSSTKPTKEASKSTSQPHETASNEAKTNSSSKKSKTTSSPKPTSKSNTNTSSIPTSSANNVSKPTTSSNINANSDPKTSSYSNNQQISNNKSNSNANPISNSNSNANNYSGNDSSMPIQNQTNNSKLVQNQSSSSNKPNRVSIGTQGEDFGNNENELNNENENAADADKLDSNDSMHLQVKMNGPEPVISSTDSIQNNDNASPKEETSNNSEHADTLDTTNNESDNQQLPKQLQQQQQIQQQQQQQQIQQESHKEEPTVQSIINNNDTITNQDDSNKLHNSDNDNANDDIHKSCSESDTKHQRAPTPPPIRPKLQTPKTPSGRPRREERKRSRTPPPTRAMLTTDFQMPPPNIVIDQEAVLVLYGRGRLEFKPLVDRIQREMLMATNYGGGGFYTQNRRITLAYVQNFSDTLTKTPGEARKTFSRTQQPVVPPITPPHATSARAPGRVNETPFIVLNSGNDRDDRSIFNGCVNSVSPAFKNRQKSAFSNSLRPNSAREMKNDGSNFFSVTIEKGANSKSPRQPSLPRITDLQRTFSPAAYVYNYKSNTETIINSLDTSSAITTPRNINNINDEANETSEEGDLEDNNERFEFEGEVTNDNSKNLPKSPRRIQSARTTGRPLLNLNNSNNNNEYHVNMPFPLSPVVMASPRRSFINKKRTLIQGNSNDNNESSNDEYAVPVDQLESAVMTKMPKLHFISSATTLQPQQQLQQLQNSNQSNVSPNFGASPNNQNYVRRLNSVRTFDRNPLMFNQPIGVAMVKPGKTMKRNAAFYASVAVTTSISNARRSSPSYRTGSARPKHPMKQSGKYDDMAGLAKTSTSEIEITVK